MRRPLTTAEALDKYCTTPPCNMCLGGARVCVERQTRSVVCPRCGERNWFDGGSRDDELPRTFSCVACGARLPFSKNAAGAAHP